MLSVLVHACLYVSQTRTKSGLLDPDGRRNSIGSEFRIDARLVAGPDVQVERRAPMPVAHAIAETSNQQNAPVRRRNAPRLEPARSVDAPSTADVIPAASSPLTGTVTSTEAASFFTSPPPGQSPLPQKAVIEFEVSDDTGRTLARAIQKWEDSDARYSLELRVEDVAPADPASAGTLRELNISSRGKIGSEGLTGLITESATEKGVARYQSGVGDASPNAPKIIFSDPTGRNQEFNFELRGYDFLSLAYQLAFQVDQPAGARYLLMFPDGLQEMKLTGKQVESLEINGEKMSTMAFTAVSADKATLVKIWLQSGVKLLPVKIRLERNGSVSVLTATQIKIERQ